jgi:streptogramin lyase
MARSQKEKEMRLTCSPLNQIWFTQNNNCIGYIDSNEERVQIAVPHAISESTAITFDNNGNLWFTADDMPLFNSFVFKYDPQTQEFTRFTIPHLCILTNIVATSANEIWVIDALSKALYNVKEMKQYPCSYFISGIISISNKFWFTIQSLEAAKIGVCDVSGDMSTLKTYDVKKPTQLGGIVLGRDNKIYFTEPGHDNIVWLDQETGEHTEVYLPNQNIKHGPMEIVAGTKGVYFTEIKTNSIGFLPYGGTTQDIKEYPLPTTEELGSMTIDSNDTLYVVQGDNIVKITSFYPTV